MSNMYYVYLIESLKNEYIYTGFTIDLKKRIEEHNKGLTYSIKNLIPFKLIHYEAFLNKQDALAREKYLKSGWGRRFVKNNLQNYFNEK